MTKFIDKNGVERSTGNNPGTVKFKTSWTVYGDAGAGGVPAARMVPRSEWKSRIGGNTGPEAPHLAYVHDQDGVGQCFPKGTLIRMADGTQKAIDEVRVLDEVLTAEGNVKRVIKTMVRKEEESLYRVHVWGHRHLRCTAEHPVLTKRGYVAAAELQRGDMVALPRYLPNRTTMIQPREYVSGRVYTTRQALRGARVYGVAGRKAAVITRHDIPDVIHLDRDFGWLIGMYLAEGFSSHGKMEFALHANEADTHGRRIISVMEALGAGAVIRKVSGKATNAIKVTIYGVQWAKLMESLCAAGCAGKRLHADLASGPEEFLAGVLEGWTDGDGIGPDANGGVTVSHQLAANMFDVANALGLRPTIETLDVKTYGQVASRQKRYLVKWGKHQDRPDYRSEQDDKCLWRKVDGVVREDFQGDVFNLEVEDDHSYVAEGVGVHNCNCDATALVVECTRLRQGGLEDVKLSSADLYARINGGVDQGSLLEDAMRVMLDTGIGTAASAGLIWKHGQRLATNEERSGYRVLEAYVCPSFDHVMSAALEGFFLVSGVLWFDNFHTDADGWLPLSGRGNYGGHAVGGYKPTYSGSHFGIWHQNSWSEEWGLGGRCVFPESIYGGQVGGWWAVRGVTRETGNLPVPHFDAAV